jgi:hypothetical protein
VVALHSYVPLHNLEHTCQSTWLRAHRGIRTCPCFQPAMPPSVPACPPPLHSNASPPAKRTWVAGHCIPAPPLKHKPRLVLPPGQDREPTQSPTTTPPATVPTGPVQLPEEPYCWASHDAIDHFTGPWSLIGVGLDRDGGWAVIQAYIDVGIEGFGEPFDAWTNVDDTRHLGLGLPT